MIKTNFSLFNILSRETVDEKNIDITFKIFEGPKIQIERVNIFGNTVTSDSY